MLSLREMTPDDLPLFRQWLQAPHVAKWYHDPEDWIGEIEEMHGAFCWVRHYIAEEDGRPVGFCQFYAARDSGEAWLDGPEQDGTYSIDYLIGSAEDLRRGFGRQILRRLTEKILACGDARRIAVQPEKENLASRSLLRADGFTCADEAQGIFVKELPGWPPETAR